MSDISIERLAEKIQMEKTKEYFREVISSYFNGNYRSAVVMLYSVVIADLLYKMRDLRDLYDDEAAKAILTRIEGIQNNNNRDASWENVLFEGVQQRTKFLSPDEYTNIEALRNHRHLSAHPALSHDINLFSPNKDTVRAHIRNMLEGVLIKPAIFSKNIFINLIKDISDNASKLAPDDLEQYVNKKYFDSLPDWLINDIFKKLWKFVFIRRDAEIDRNRKINYKVLEILFRNNKEQILNYVRENSDYFEVVTDDYNLFQPLVNFLFENPNFYDSFSEPKKILIKDKVNNNVQYKILSVFLYDDIDEYAKGAYTMIPELNNYFFGAAYIGFLQCLSFLKKNDIEINALAIGMFAVSGSYSVADTRFSDLIEPNLERFTVSQLNDILSVMGENEQISGRFRSTKDYQLVKDELTRQTET